MLRRRRRGPAPTVERQPDALPKRGLFAEPVRLARLDALEAETLDDGRRRVSFLVEVRDAQGRRCPDLSVQARVTGPERSAVVQGTTDLMGRLRFRMAGPAGDYRLEITDVAAGGLDWDAEAGPRHAETSVG